MEISPSAIKQSIADFLRRFHMVIFSVIIIGGLSIVVLVLNNIIVRSGEAGDYTPASNNITFDQETIDRVNQLKSRDEASQQLNLSQGRINPFVE